MIAVHENVVNEMNLKQKASQKKLKKMKSKMGMIKIKWAAKLKRGHAHLKIYLLLRVYNMNENIKKRI